MDKNAYMQTQMLLIQIGKAASKLDIEGFLRAINNAETAGPIIDPTMYRKAQDNLSAVKKLAEAFLPIKGVFTNLHDQILKTAIAEHAAKEEQKE